MGVAESLNNVEFEAFLDQILSLRAKRKSTILPKEESKLMEKINASLTITESETYKELIEKREEENLSNSEYEELIRLSDKLETIHSVRISSLYKLANLKGITLQEVMNYLEIRPINVED